MLGLDVAAKSTDGHTLAIGFNGPVANAAFLYKKTPYDPARDLKPIVMTTSQANVLAVHAEKVPAKTAAELAAWLKSQGGKANYASLGNGSSAHLTMELFLSEAGAQATHVPFNGSPPAALSVAQGESHATFMVAPALLPHVQSGKVRLIAVSSRQRLEADHAVLEALLQAVPAGLILADARGRIVRSNPAHQRIWGPSPPTGSMDDDGRWKGWWADGSVRQGRAIQAEEWPMARALRGEPVTDDLVEIEPFDRPGQRLTLLITSAPVRDAHGHITGAVVAQLDVTALVKAQAAERESAGRFRSLADNIAQLAWMTDDAGAIVWYNRRWYEYTGTTAEQMKGWGWQSVHHPDHADRVITKFRRHIVTGEPWEDTFPLRGAEGQYRWFLSRAFPIRDQGGRVMSWFGTNTDITAQRQAEEALREADRRKDEFIAVLAHELRNPLAPIAAAAVPAAMTDVAGLDAMVDDLARAGRGLVMG